MNHSPLGTDPLRRSLFRKTEEATTSKIVPQDEVITPPEAIRPEIPVTALAGYPKRFDVLTFYLGVEEFGIEVNRIKEIVRLVEITPVPKAPNFIEGIIDVRGEIVPVISLKKMFALGEEKYTLHTQIIITEIDTRLPARQERIIGLVCDATAEIIVLDKEKIKSPMETIPLHNFLFGIAELEERLLLLLDLDKILSYEQKALLEMLTAGLEKVTPPPAGEAGIEEEKMVRLAPRPELGTKAHHPEKDRRRELTPEEKAVREILRQRALELSKKKIIEEKEKKQVVIFSVSEEFYGLEINQVKEVSKGKKIVYLPSVPVYLSGIINLRGELVPVVNLSRLFGIGLTSSPEMVTSSTNGEIKIVITETKSIKVGFLVDTIYDVVSLTVDSFEPPLATIEKGKIDYLSAQAHWENKILALLNLENIVKSI